MSALAPISSPDASNDDALVCRFRPVPPRHFDYPALLLLLAEEPRHGYRLVGALHSLGLERASRPSVYRALAALERDGLLESWSAQQLAGSTRRVYGLTAAGHEQLDAWMELVSVERDALDHAIFRYRRLANEDQLEMPTTKPT